jgi:hypothetical protein
MRETRLDSCGLGVENSEIRGSGNKNSYFCIFSIG